MIHLDEDIRSLSEFQRNAKKCLQRLKRTGRPEVLTVNGQARVVVQDAAAYQKLLEQLAHANELGAVRVGVEQMRRGESRPFAEAAREARAKHARPRTTRTRRTSK